MSQLVVTEIISKPLIQDRVTCIEKWTAIADILACTHNFNGVLQICAAFVNSSIYRLSKTWERLTKQTKQIISKLQNLVSSEDNKCRQPTAYCIHCSCALTNSSYFRPQSCNTSYLNLPSVITHQYLATRLLFVIFDLINIVILHYSLANYLQLTPFSLLTLDRPSLVT